MSSLIKNEIISLDQQQIYILGIERIWQKILHISVYIGFGIIFNKTQELLFFLSFYSTYRKFTGGYHARRKTACLFITFIIAIVATAVYRFELLEYFSSTSISIVFILTSIFMSVQAPIDCANRSFDDEEKNYFKRCAIRTIILCMQLFYIALFYKIESIYYTIFISSIINAIMIFIQLTENIHKKPDA